MKVTKRHTTTYTMELSQEEADAMVTVWQAIRSANVGRASGVKPEKKALTDKAIDGLAESLEDEEDD